MKKCSFDFDQTLSLPIVQLYAKELISKGIEVWLCTTRYDDKHRHLYHPSYTNIDINKDLKEVCDEVGIPVDKRLFTNMIWKAEFFNANDDDDVEYGFLFHLDNSDEECHEAIEKNCKIPFINVEEEGWQDKCNKLLNL